MTPGNLVDRSATRVGAGLGEDGLLTSGPWAVGACPVHAGGARSIGHVMGQVLFLDHHPVHVVVMEVAVVDEVPVGGVEHAEADADAPA
jgi:hypothetical protein